MTAQWESIDGLRETLAETKKDTFETGTVIRWTAADRYTYVAIKTPAGWFTSASTRNTFVDSRMDYAELIETLGQSDVTNIAIATSWETL